MQSAMCCRLTINREIRLNKKIPRYRWLAW